MKTFTYKYPMPSIACDIVLINSETDSIYLIKRKKSPHKNKLALVGGFFDANNDASIKNAALRELKEETGIQLKKIELISGYPIYDAIGRDSRGRVVSVVYVADIRDVEIGSTTPVANDDAAEIVKFNYLELLNLHKKDFAFDHYDILMRFIAYYVAKQL